MAAVIQVCAILNISALAILNNILVRLNCDLAGIAACRIALNCISDRVVACKQRNGKLLVRRPVRRAYDSHPKVRPDVVLRRGERLVRHGQGVLFPDRVNGHARSPLGQRNIWGDRFAVAGLPALEGVAVTDGNLPGERERCITLAVRLRLRFRHIGDIVRRVLVVGQGVGDLRVGILRDQIDRRTLVAGRRPGLVEGPNRRVRIRFLAPANDLIAALHRRSVRSCLDIADRDRMVGVGRVAVRRRVLAYKLCVFRCTVIVADAELIADIKNGESYIDLIAGIQCLRTDTVVSC